MEGKNLLRCGLGLALLLNGCVTMKTAKRTEPHIDYHKTGYYSTRIGNDYLNTIGAILDGNIKPVYYNNKIEYKGPPFCSKKTKLLVNKIAAGEDNIITDKEAEEIHGAVISGNLIDFMLEKYGNINTVAAECDISENELLQEIEKYNKIRKKLGYELIDKKN